MLACALRRDASTENCEERRGVSGRGSRLPDSASGIGATDLPTRMSDETRQSTTDSICGWMRQHPLRHLLLPRLGHSTCCVIPADTAESILRPEICRIVRKCV